MYPLVAFPALFQNIYLQALLSLPAAITAARGASSSYYLIDFNSPSSIPLVGFESSQPTPNSFSFVPFGNIAWGAFPGTGLSTTVFNTTGNVAHGSGFYYDQAQLRFYQTGAIHYLSAELYITGLLPSLALLGLPAFTFLLTRRSRHSG